MEQILYLIMKYYKNGNSRSRAKQGYTILFNIVLEMLPRDKWGKRYKDWKSIQKLLFSDNIFVFIETPKILYINY